MKAIINGNIYDDISWTENVLTMETDMPLSDIETAFTPGSDANISIYDGDEEIAHYINKGIVGLYILTSEPRAVTVTFQLTQFIDDAKVEIQNSIEDSDGAIVELAEIVSEITELGLEETIATVGEHKQAISEIRESVNEADIPGIRNTLQSHQETLNTWFATANDVMEFINALRMENGILDMLDRRIRALEQKE